MDRRQHDDEYEMTTVAADRWRDRLAQRHRFGRALDLPAPSRRDDRPTGIYGAALIGLTLWLLALVAMRALGWL